MHESQIGDGTFVTAVDVSPVGTYMAFGDAGGGIHLLTAAEEGMDIPLNGTEGQPIEWADIPDAPQQIIWEEST